MGYLKQKLRRSRAATIRRPDTLAQAGGWFPASNPSLAPEHHFIRFCTSNRATRSQQHLGIFHAAGQLKRSAELPARRLKELSATLRWFNQNLSAPNRVPEDAVFWFKSDAAECIGQVWNLVHMLKDFGWEVLMMATRAPGRVVYADEFQVAAIRFADRPVAGMPLITE